MSSSVAATAGGYQHTAFIVEPTGVHKFTYKKVTPETGEAVWRWPNEPSLAQTVEPKGQLLDVRA